MNRDTLSLFLPLTLVTSAVMAGDVEVNWLEPEHFADIGASNDTRQHYQDQVLTDLEAHFKQAGKNLPEDQTLVVNVTDLDLAGYLEYFHPSYPFGLRVVRDIDYPRITLDYELKAADGSTLATGSEKLKDMGFHYSSVNIRYAEPLDYEKRMIDRWISERF